MSMSEDTDVQDVGIEFVTEGEEIVNPVTDEEKGGAGIKVTRKPHERFSVFDKMCLEDPFVQDNGYSWDFILVAEWDEERKGEQFDFNDIGLIRNDGEEKMGDEFEDKQKQNVREIVHRCLTAGLDVETQMARDGKHMIVKLRASQARLAQHAAAIGYKLLLDKEKVALFETKADYDEETGKREDHFTHEGESMDLVKGLSTHYGHREIKWDEIPDATNETCPIFDQLFSNNIATYDYIYQAYDPAFSQLYKTIEGRNHPWKSTDRVKLIESILRYKENEGLLFQPYKFPDGQYNSQGGELINQYSRELDAIECETGGCSFALRAMKGYKEFEYYEEEVVDHDGHRTKFLLPVCYLQGYFPLHDDKKKEHLLEEWIYNWYPFISPVILEEIRQYFGEKLGLYFKFLDHYSMALMIPAFVGFIPYGIIQNSGHWENEWIAVYAVLICLWGILFLETWKRKEKFTALSWGMVGFEKEEQNRPEYDDAVEEMEITPSPITGEPEQVLDTFKQEVIITVSATLVTVFIAIVVGCIAGTLLLRYDKDQSTLASFVNAISIMLFDYIYSNLAVYLTDLECPRTDTRYEDSLIAKLFIFKFINSFSSMAFLAFAVPTTGIYNSESYAIDTGDDVCTGTDLYIDAVSGGYYCGAPLYCSSVPDVSDTYSMNRYNCFALLQMKSLEYNLLIVYLTGIVVGNFQEVLLPICLKKYAEYQEAKEKAEKEANGETVEPKKECVISDQFEMEVYDEIMGTLSDYAELAVQYGYTTLFVIAFPLTPFLAFVSAILESKVDGGKLLLSFQRPVAKSIEDIGTWQIVFLITTIFAVLSNLAMMAFRTPILTKNSDIPPVWGFVICQYALFVFMYLVGEFIPDTPGDVEIQLQRTEFILNSLQGLQDDVAYELRKDVPEAQEKKLDASRKTLIDSMLSAATNKDL